MNIVGMLIGMVLAFVVAFGALYLTAWLFGDGGAIHGMACGVVGIIAFFIFDRLSFENDWFEWM